MTIKINDQQHLFPTSWDKVTFGQFLNLHGAKDSADVLSVFLNMSAPTLRRAYISNLTEVLRVLSFLDKPMPSIIPISIKGFLIPKDLNFRSIGQFEDLKLLAKEVAPAKGEEMTPDRMMTYIKIIAVYAMPNYNEAGPEERDEFSKQFLNSPAPEVLAIGNFTLAKLIELNLPAQLPFLKVNILMRRFRLVLKSWRARLGFWARYYLWKRKLHTKGMNF